MTDHRPHVPDEELILYFYGETPGSGPVGHHLAACERCRSSYDRLKHVLALVDTADAFGPVQTPGPAFEREVWARLEPRLAAAREPWLTRLFHSTPRWAVTVGIATLVLAAFVAGRLSIDAPPENIAAAAPTLAERVLVVAVVDHLDRSQMVLLEVLNADVESAGDLRAEQTLARELVAANRLYRRTAAQTGDGSTSDVLDALERALLEIANTPQDATKDELDALRARIASQGLLFKVRVVHAELRERERQTSVSGSQS